MCIRGGHRAESVIPATFFGSGFEFLGKSQIRREWYGVYRMLVKAIKTWQRYTQI